MSSGVLAQAATIRILLIQMWTPMEKFAILTASQSLRLCESSLRNLEGAAANDNCESSDADI